MARNYTVRAPLQPIGKASALPKCSAEAEAAIIRLEITIRNEVRYGVEFNLDVQEHLLA